MADRAAADVVLAYVTAPSAEEGERLAQALVSERLAACVNLVPAVTSFYRWKGRVQRDPEVLLLVKTTRARAGDLCARVTALHPYDVPCVVAYEAIGGHEPYLRWVAEQTRP